MDDYLVKKIRKRQKRDSSHENSHKFNKNKKLLTMIMQNTSSLGSLSENLSTLVTEDAIDDICEIFTISSDRSNLKKNTQNKTSKKKKPEKKGLSEKKDGKFNTKVKKLKNLHP